jgi:hypothetical protein
MSEILVRQARLDDTRAICELFCARVPVWQRLDAHGRAEDQPYEALTIYERWLHGGAWMSVETGAIFLSHLLCGAGQAIVAEQGTRVVGYAEAYTSDEPAPYGAVLHLAHLVTRDADTTIRDVLMRHLAELAQEQRRARLTVSFSRYDSDSCGAYTQYGMKLLVRVGQYALTAQTGQSFYRTTEHFAADPAQIDGWYMTAGRLESARQHWENLWPRLWDAVEEITARQTHRLHFSAAGQEAFVCCQQHLYDPRSADVYCWSPKPLSTQLLMAIRDWAHRHGYRRLVFAMPETQLKLLGPDSEVTPYQQDIYAVDL